MRKLLIKLLLFALVLLIVTARAHATSGPNDPWVTPPAKYVHPFRGKVVVHWNATPIALGAFWPVYGFSFVIGDTCHIQVWRSRYRPSLYYHELAHCNGWPANHPPK